MQQILMDRSYQWWEGDIPIVEFPKPPIITGPQDIYRNWSLTNTRYFRESALHFYKHGRYTLAPPNTREWIEFWARESARCLHGMKVGDLWISGKHYFYLNYCPIDKIPDQDYLEMHPHTPRYNKKILLPSPWEVDFQWWYTKEWVRQKAEKGDLDCHIICLKTRRAGFSYKEAAEGVYNYIFLGSNSAYYAHHKNYLEKDGIFNKVNQTLEYVEKHTPWKLTKAQGGNRQMFKQAAATGAKMMAQVIDDPHKARGGGLAKVTFEEGGSLPGGLTAWQVCLPTVREGGVTVGFMTIFGTGGGGKESAEQTNDGMEALEEMYYKPKAYGCVSFENIWDEGLRGTECGFFVPATMVRSKHIDRDGNVDKEGAFEDVMVEREMGAEAKNAELARAENPITPQEALKRPGGNTFPIEEILAQKHYILANEIHKNPKRIKVYDIEGDNVNTARLVHDPNLMPYMAYPVKKDGREKPAYPTIIEDRYTEVNSVGREEVPGEIGDIYHIVVDPVMKDKAPTSASVFAAYVMKAPNKYDNRIANKPVAWLVGRYHRRDKYYIRLFVLAKHFNAKIQSEQQGGGDGIIDYARENGFEHYLSHDLTFDSTKEINIDKQSDFFVNMSTRRENSSISYLNDWLREEVRFDPDHPIAKDGKVLRVHYIYDLGLLTELEKYNDEANFDRISALRLWALQIRQLALQEQNKKEEDDDFFDRMFTGQSTQKANVYMNAEGDVIGNPNTTREKVSGFGELYPTFRENRKSGVLNDLF